MKNDIYDLLNDIDNQIDTFETVDITSTDLKNWKTSFAAKKKASTKKHTWKKYVAAAAAFVLILGGSSAPVRQNVYAQSQQIMESLSTLLGINGDISPYSTIVGKSLSKDGITVTLNEVILDGNKLIISYKAKADNAATLKKLKAKNMDELFIGTDILINGKNVSQSSGGSSHATDSLTSVGSSEIELDDSSALSGKSNFAIDFNCSTIKSSISLGKLKFTASDKELQAVTTTVPLHYTFTLPDKTKITLKNYRGNCVNQQISFTKKDSGSGINGDLILKGKDNLGNPVEFYLSTTDETNGEFEIDRINGFPSSKATSMTLTPYYAEYNTISDDKTDTSDDSGAAKIIGGGNAQIFEVTDSTESAPQKITASSYKKLGKSFTINIK